MAITKKIKIKNMHCNNCERIIAKRIKSLDGIENVCISYAKESGEITFDENKTDFDKIVKTIEEEGYECSLIEEKQTKTDKQDDSSEYYTFDKKLIGSIFGIIGLFLVGFFLFKLYNNISLPQITQNMGYGLLFLVGILTGFHCIAMCGGFLVSYTTKDAQEGRKSYKSHFMYGLGKTISYTIIGAAFGLLGSIIAFTPTMRGFAGIIAGLFLIVFGINMLGFNFLRKLRFTTPAPVSNMVDKESKKHKSPLVIGLLNGLMIACGPLQAIYIMAAGTGSMIEGAKILFIFGLGTLPVMLGFGFLATLVSKNLTHKILKSSGVIVILLGLIMLNRGFALTGSGLDTNTLFNSVSADTNINSNSAASIEGNYQIIRMDVTANDWEPNKFVLKTGVPVKWIINGKELNGCNSGIIVPKLSLNFDIKPGEQTIEFTPKEEGTIPWSCWMGMIRGTFIVKNNIDTSNTAAVQKELNSVNVPSGGSCGGSGGGCGCGGAR